MLTALGKWVELGTHVRGAIRNGATEVEIREALLQARYVFYSLFSWFGLVLRGA
jgi:alkylhydroperoxidase/carboxymuconolactone decarboxylase family protein YurZ